jgi:hypothetical protein
LQVREDLLRFESEEDRMARLLMAVIVVVVFVTLPAAAKLVKVGWVSESDLKTKCAENGGTFSSGATGYNCSKKCGDNDTCVYGCSKDKEHNECNGSVPFVKTPTKITVEGVLNAGVKPKGQREAGPRALQPGLLGQTGPLPAAQSPASTGNAPAAPAAPAGRLY